MAASGSGPLAALMDTDPWRDLTPEQWREQGQKRPRRRPKPDQTFPALEAPPLGVWLVDWASPGGEDEALPREHAPWLLPTAVQRAGVADPLALAALAKRREYLPAGWVNEDDDRTATSGVLTVTFETPPPSAPEALLVFSARLNRAAEIRVDGELCIANVLGTAARKPPAHDTPRRGWHVWNVVSPEGRRPSGPCTFRVDFGSARCSQLLLSLVTPPLLAP